MLKDKATEKKGSRSQNDKKKNSKATYDGPAICLKVGFMSCGIFLNKYFAWKKFFIIKALKSHWMDIS
jgi:hypothetical protein